MAVLHRLKPFCDEHSVVGHVVGTAEALDDSWRGRGTLYIPPSAAHVVLPRPLGPITYIRMHGCRCREAEVL